MMTYHDDLTWLTENHFMHVGHWAAPHTKLTRLVILDRSNGIYAFVMDRRIRYIGKASSLRSRIRQYNRSLDPCDKRKRRKVHNEIFRAWTDNSAIDVWVYDFDKDRDGHLGELETKWIDCRRPDWNE